MSKVEKELLRHGAVLVRQNRHKIYELNGRRFTVSHGNTEDRRSRCRPVIRYLKTLDR